MLRLSKALLLLDARLAFNGGPPLCPAAEHLRAQHQEAVDREEAGSCLWVREQGLQRVFEKYSEDPGWDRAHEQQHREAFGIVLDLSSESGGEKAADDGDPLVAVDDQERGRRAQVQQDEKGDERRVRGLELPVQKARDQHRMSE